MTSIQLKKAQEQTPFEPFTVCLSDQRQFHVPHPEFMWVMPDKRTVFIYEKESRGATWIDVLHVTSIKFDEQKKSKVTK
jgi:hypothetical protein